MRYKIAPSLLCMDLLHVGEQLRIMEKYADYLHMDIMDTRFVPSLGLCPAFVKAVAKDTSLPVDCHLMVEDPLELIPDLADMGVKTVITHAEVMVTGGFRILDVIDQCGMKAGVAINPATPVSAALPFIKRIKRLTVMTIEPGFPGAAFIWDTVDKIKEAAELREEYHLDFEIEMDGSLCDENLGALAAAGCDVFVAGSAALFDRGDDLEENFKALRARFEPAGHQEESNGG